MKPPKILLYGQFGTGKTMFTLTGGKRAQVIDLDDGLRSGLTYKDEWQGARIAAINNALSCHEDNPNTATAFSKAQSYIRSILDQCLAKKYPYDILVIDSLTTMSEYCMRSILNTNGMLGKNPQIQHWGLRDIAFKELLITIKAMPIVVILLAHIQSDEIDGVPTVSPAIAGKQLPPMLFSQFDEILYIKVRTIAQGKTEYIIQNQGTGSVLARTRSNFPDFYNVNNGLPKLLELMGHKLD